MLRLLSVQAKQNIKHNTASRYHSYCCTWVVTQSWSWSGSPSKVGREKWLKQICTVSMSSRSVTFAVGLVSSNSARLLAWSTISCEQALQGNMHRAQLHIQVTLRTIYASAVCLHMGKELACRCRIKKVA